ncbi:MAG: phosphomannomutase/phosphoglucomutase [Candidatus Anammoxibacter sp.]
MVQVQHSRKSNINVNIFKSYDIRGIFPDEINEDTAKKIGAAFAEFLKDQNSGVENIVVGRDMRLSSPAISDSLIDGIKSLGVNVIDIGLVSTEMTYFAVGFYRFDASIMVTASHNPGQYTGFKLCREKAIPISANSGLSTIAEIAQKSDTQLTGKPGNIIKKNIYNDYKTFILNFINKPLKPLKIVIDAGNGMAGKTIPIVFDNVPCKIIPLYFKLDGNFPNHEANPLEPDNLIDLQKEVVKSKSDFGVAFDGDADRCIFVDETGGIIGADIMTAVIADEFLANEKNATIIYDLRSSKVVAESIKASGGTPIRESVGHSHIKARMRETNAVFAGELSGHYYYRDNNFADSGLITLVQVMNILSKKKVTMSNLISTYKKYFATGEINFEVEDKDAKIKQLANKFADGTIDYLDGITIDYGDWWFNVRKSNTEPMLRLNLEAKTKKLLEKKSEIVIDAIKQN